MAGHEHPSPFPVDTPDGGTVVNERCQCGALRTDHADTEYAFGHGGNDDTGCAKFRWAGHVYDVTWEPVFVALTAHHWGIGATPDDAKRQARKAGADAPMRSRKWLVKLLPPGAYDVTVTDMGDIAWRFRPGWPTPTTTPHIIERPNKSKR